MHYKYHTGKNEEFHQESYPDVLTELESIHRDSARMSGNFKSDIVISFLKDHSLDIRWIEMNPKFVKFMTARSVSTVHLESRFASCQGNSLFLGGLESCIKKQLR